MKDNLKWWGILLLALISVFVTSHFSAKSQKLSNQTAARVEGIEELLTMLIERQERSSASILQISNNLELTRVRLSEAVETNRSLLTELTLALTIKPQASPSTKRSGQASELSTEPLAIEEELNMAIQAFDRRTLEYRESLEPMQSRMLEGLRDSTVDMIFQNSNLAGIETPDELEKFKGELRESGELQKMYDAIEKALVGEMMLDAIGDGQFPWTPDSAIVEGNEDVE